MARQSDGINVAALIENQKLSRFQIIVIILASAIMAIEGYDMQVLAYAAPAIIKEWGVSKAYFGPVFGFGLFGYMLGATLLASLSDRWGRKKLIIAGLLFFGLFTFAAAYSASLNDLLILRFIAGLGLGASIPTVIALAAEYMPSRFRATAIGLMFIGYNIGAAGGGFIAAKFIPSFGWPSVFQLGGIVPALLAFTLIFALPESIRFLVLKGGRRERISALLGRLAPSQIFDPGSKFILSEENQRGLPVKHLFTDGRAIMTSLLWLAFVASLMGHYFLTSWLPTVLFDAGVPLAHAVIATALLHVGGIVGSLLVGRLLDKHGIVAVAVAFAIAVPLTVLIGAVGTSEMLLMTLVFLSGVCLLGGQVGLNAVSGSVYPTYIRSTGAGWAFGVGRIGSIIGPVLGGILISLKPPDLLLFAYAAIPILLCTGATYLLSRSRGALRRTEVPATN
ncbi:MAG TPA: MFS transporter [Patescibacteria group bacterium]|nr:MFS transporter [Patescibacteria group bacterium]